MYKGTQSFIRTFLVGAVFQHKLHYSTEDITLYVFSKTEVSNIHLFLELNNKFSNNLQVKQGILQTPVLGQLESQSTEDLLIGYLKYIF